MRRGGRGLLGLGKLECIECAGYAGSTHSVLTVAAGKRGDKFIQRVFQDRKQVKVGCHETRSLVLCATGVKEIGRGGGDELQYGDKVENERATGRRLASSVMLVSVSV